MTQSPPETSTDNVQPMVGMSLRVPEHMRKALMVRAAKETASRGQRISVNTLIIEAIAKAYDIKVKV